ncbi:hypothetical protein CLV29_0064 [Naumannella halotolerans]|uniref:Uncharacterized protein n=1 Tax=Naumannella halotolerans TaxID=993414 RepID=A0A4R7J6Y5_9ACTN|nr:hypothetical protein CLV29_0064 [Naumannella halotolerans]
MRWCGTPAFPVVELRGFEPLTFSLRTISDLSNLPVHRMDAVINVHYGR